MIRLPAVRYKLGVERIIIEVPKMYHDSLTVLVQNNKTGFLCVDLSNPKRERTTGKHSQNHAINGFVSQICCVTGQDFDTVKSVMKKRAVDAGYPFDTEIMTGEIIPLSESKINTEHAAILINTIKQFCAEYMINLKE